MSNARLEQPSPWSGTVVTCPLCTHWRVAVPDQQAGWRELYHHLRDSHRSARAAQLAARARKAGWFASRRS